MDKNELRAKILATANPKPLAIDVPQWGQVFVKQLTVADMESATTDVDPKLRMARGMARVLCSADGELLFDPTNVDDLFALSGLPISSITLINGAVNQMNAGTKEAAEELGNDSPLVTDSSST